MKKTIVSNYRNGAEAPFRGWALLPGAADAKNQVSGSKDNWFLNRASK